MISATYTLTHLGEQLESTLSCYTKTCILFFITSVIPDNFHLHTDRKWQSALVSFAFYSLNILSIWNKCVSLSSSPIHIASIFWGLLFDSTVEKCVKTLLSRQIFSFVELPLWLLRVRGFLTLCSSSARGHIEMESLYANNGWKETIQQAGVESESKYECK